MVELYVCYVVSVVRSALQVLHEATKAKAHTATHRSTRPVGHTPHRELLRARENRGDVTTPRRRGDRARTKLGGKFKQ